MLNVMSRIGPMTPLGRCVQAVRSMYSSEVSSPGTTGGTAWNHFVTRVSSRKGIANTYPQAHHGARSPYVLDVLVLVSVIANTRPRWDHPTPRS